MSKKWFKVTVKETYRKIYYVKATEADEAEYLLEEAINDNIVNPTETGVYERDIVDRTEIEGEPELGLDDEKLEWRGEIRVSKRIA